MSQRTLIYPVFLPMRGCKHRCIYCDQTKISGGSGFDLAIELANVARFVNNHKDVAKEIAFYGSSFTAMPVDYINSLLQEFNRVIDKHTTYRISTHPLSINSHVLINCKQQNIGCIELGIQDFCDEVLAAAQRGYTGIIALEAALAVREQGFKLGVQLMPGMPGSNSASIIHNQNILRQLKPDYLRLYPLVVIHGTLLADLYKMKEYCPLTLNEAIDICADYVEIAVAEGIAVIKLGLPSNLSLKDVVAGPFHPSFGEFVKAELLVRGILQKLREDKEIILDKKSRLLLMGHKGKYRTTLIERLENCSLDEQAISHIL